MKRLTKACILDVTLSVIIIAMVIAFYLVPLSMIWLVVHAHRFLASHAGVLLGALMVAVVVGVLAIGL